MKKYDVIVIGSGPAGNLFASLTAAARLSVLVIEKDSAAKPYSQRLCLSPDCLHLWERQKLFAEFTALPHTRLKNISFSFGSNPPIDFPPSPDGKEIYSIDKEVLNGWLRERAIAAGAEYLPGIRCQEVDFARRLNTDAGEFHSKVLVGADGRNSWVARMANFPLRKIRHPKTAWLSSSQLPGSDSAHFKFFKEGYFGFMPTSGSHTDLFMMLKKDCTHAPQKFMNDFFPGNDHLSWHSLPPAITYAATPAKNNILLIGDAAKTVEPLTGHGIYLALKSAEIAANLVIETQLKGGWNYLDDRYIYQHNELYGYLSQRNRIANFFIKYPRCGTLAVKYAARYPRIAQNYLPYFSGLENIGG
ncbi:MAG: NAD(P)/FAD-dependent oxidoreductase [Verrucomicrobiales bacterium]|nr:NAD(P)/FAD-dependent oxidoreductase [Verrucomicrobiales bacterium]